MPLSKVNYANTIIYRIFSDNCDYVYVGSTTNFVARKSQHKSSCNTEINKSYNSKVYEMIRANGGWDNFKMLEIEEYHCECSKEAKKREQYWIDFYKSNLNTYKAVISQEQKSEYQKEYGKHYYIEHTEEIKDKIKQYYQQHKEELTQKITCECGDIVQKQCLTRHKKSKKHLDKL
jgi:hypothetical protein